MTRFLVAATLLAPACTLHFDDGDDDGDDRPDDPPPVRPEDPGAALLIVGTNPSVQRFDGDWATVWLNYPSLDCNPVDLYGATVPVRIDATFERFVADTGLDNPETFVQGWLTVRRQSANHLWRVTEWVPEGGPQPACYNW